jgi:hypothetical protein
LRNLAQDEKYSEKVRELSREMDRWLEEIGDQPGLSERELITSLWQGADFQPRTSNPEVSFSRNDGLVTITSKTNGASIGYKLIVDGFIPANWNIYSGESVKMLPGSLLRVQAHRIGYLPSEKLDFLWPEQN